MRAALSPYRVTWRAKLLSRRPILPGQRFGRLTALRPNGTFRGGDVYRFRCSCGAELDRLVAGVRSAWARGHSPSCAGCA